MTHADGPVTNFSELIRRAGVRHPARPAMLDAGRSVSWSQLDRAADAAAADLLESGAGVGDRAVLALPSSPDLVLALVGAARAGVVAVPVDPTRADLAAVADRVGARIVISADPHAELDLPIGLLRDAVHGWWRSERAPVAAVGGGEDLAVLARASRSYRAVMISHRAVLAAVLAATAAPQVRLGADDRVVMALPVHHLAGLVTGFLPLAVAGAAAVFPAIDPASGDLSGIPALIREQRISVVPGAPGVYRALLATEQVERALASVRLMTSGASPLSPADFSAIRAVTGQSVWEGYGISESTAVVASSLMTSRPRPGSVGRPLPGIQIRIDAQDPDETEDGVAAGAPDDNGVVVDDMVNADDLDDADDPDDADDDGTAVLDSSAASTPEGVEPAGTASEGTASDGTAADGTAPESVPPQSDSAPVEVRPHGPGALMSGATAVDGNLADVSGIGDVGRIGLSGATLFSGYWPDGADGPDENGWYCSEDIGFFDDLGELHLVDRADETFTVSGFTVYPKEIEQILVQHEAIGGAVIGAVRGSGPKPSRIVAVLSTRLGHESPSQDELAEFVAQRLPVFKRPAEFAFVAAIPLTELGRQNRSAALDLAGYAIGNGPVAVLSTPRPSMVLDTPSEPAAPAVEPFTPTGSVAAQDDASPEPMPAAVGPEQVADLESLGGRLPGAGNRRARSLSDDDDLFGDDFS